MTLYQAQLGTSCHGFVVDAKGLIVEAAPIMKWAIGKPLQLYSEWLCRKGGRLEAVTTQSPIRGLEAINRC